MSLTSILYAITKLYDNGRVHDIYRDLLVTTEATGRVQRHILYGHTHTELRQIPNTYQPMRKCVCVVRDVSVVQHIMELVNRMGGSLWSHDDILHHSKYIIETLTCPAHAA